MKNILFFVGLMSLSSLGMASDKNSELRAELAKMPQVMPESMQVSQQLMKSVIPKIEAVFAEMKAAPQKSKPENS